MQDAFAMLCTGRKRDGTYVDLGAGHYSRGSNTFRLEVEYGWSGIAAEKDVELAAEFLSKRTGNNFFYDALDPNLPSAIRALAGSEGIIDFLSLDLEPPDLTYLILMRIMSDPDIRFRVACVEHDAYRGGDAGARRRDLMRAIMESRGYIMVSEVGARTEDGKQIMIEDWWIHRDAGLEGRAELLVGEGIP